jgi:hypothetical protein
MRRPNRAIEVFDISLMAVVTKAMGAFLVIMLLLMPYYSSGPVGEKSASDLATTIKQTQDQLKIIADKLKQPNLDLRELERLLEEARRRLRAARALLAQLKRENDQLNAQVDRLQSQLDATQQQLQAAQVENERLREVLAERNKPRVVTQLVNVNCFNIRMELVVAERKNDVYLMPDGTSTRYFFNEAVVPYTLTLTNGESGTHQGSRFNISSVNEALDKGKTYLLIVLFRDTVFRKLNGRDGYTLKKSTGTCHSYINIDMYDPVANKHHLLRPLAPDFYLLNYALVLFEFVLTQDKDNNHLATKDATPEDQEWLQDQIAHAEKAN